MGHPVKLTFRFLFSSIVSPDGELLLSSESAGLDSLAMLGPGESTWGGVGIGVDSWEVEPGSMNAKSE